MINRAAISIFCLSLLLVTKTQAHIRASQVLHNFSISNTTQRHQFKAQGALASVGSFTSLIAAQNVSLQLKNLKTHKVSLYHCASFTLEMKDLFSTCELKEKRLILTFDMTHSRLHSYPLPP